MRITIKFISRKSQYSVPEIEYLQSNKRLNGIFAENRRKNCQEIEIGDETENAIENEDGMSNIANLEFTEFKRNLLCVGNGLSIMKLIGIHLLNKWQSEAIWQAKHNSRFELFDCRLIANACII